MKHEGSLPSSQNPTTYPYSIPDEPSLRPFILYLQEPFYYYYPFYARVFQVVAVTNKTNHNLETTNSVVYTIIVLSRLPFVAAHVTRQTSVRRQHLPLKS